MAQKIIKTAFFGIFFRFKSRRAKKWKIIAKKCVFKDFLSHFYVKNILFLLEISPLCKRLFFSWLLGPNKWKIRVKEFILYQTVSHEKQLDTKIRFSSDSLLAFLMNTKKWKKSPPKFDFFGTLYIFPNLFYYLYSERVLTP